nr:MAG TPA: hypothetical protein [Caudoviricetes sp.]
MTISYFYAVIVMLDTLATKLLRDSTGSGNIAWRIWKL